MLQKSFENAEILGVFDLKPENYPVHCNKHSGILYTIGYLVREQVAPTLQFV